MNDEEKTEEEIEAELDLIPPDAFDRLAAYLSTVQETENAFGEDVYINRALSVVIEFCILKSKP